MGAYDGIQIYFAICTLQLEFWEFKYNIFACKLLVDTSEGLNLGKILQRIRQRTKQSKQLSAFIHL